MKIKEGAEKRFKFIDFVEAKLQKVQEKKRELEEKKRKFMKFAKVSFRSSVRPFDMDIPGFLLLFVCFWVVVVFYELIDVHTHTRTRAHTH